MNLTEFTKTTKDNLVKTFTEEFISTVLESICLSKKRIDSYDIPNTFGIYVFYLKRELIFEDYEKFSDLWNEDGYTYYPKAIKKNFGECKLVNGFIPFYVGKAEKINTRIKEHLTLEKNKTTYSLKLNERKNIKREDFEVGYWSLDNEINGTHFPDKTIEKQVKQIIITIIEQEIRKQLKPLVGKQ